jgi:mono/diheme cytochrome c family protein
MTSKFATNACVAVAGALLLTVAAAPLQAEDAPEGESKFEYTVEDGRVDPGVMMGWEVYTGTCMACHGPDGLGSSFAPSLVRAAERRTFEEFAQTIAEGRDILPGQVMPSFAGDMRVMSHIGDIWNYLGARAEGALGRGRPQPLAAEGEAEEDAADAG